MKEVITSILELVIAVTFPIIAGVASAYIKKRGNNASAQSYLSEVAEAVATAVSATSQTYVDRLKKSGEFDIEAQTIAKAAAIDMALSMISSAAQTYINEYYGNIKDYLANKIEETVRKQKYP